MEPQLEKQKEVVAQVVIKKDKKAVWKANTKRSLWKHESQMDEVHKEHESRTDDVEDELKDNGDEGNGIEAICITKMEHPPNYVSLPSESTNDWDTHEEKPKEVVKPKELNPTIETTPIPRSQGTPPAVQDTEREPKKKKNTNKG